VEYRWTGGEWERRGEVRKQTDVPLQFTPCSIPGQCIKDHINKWHKLNPSTSTSTSLMYEINPVAASS
jgi:hypothetical protein